MRVIRNERLAKSSKFMFAGSGAANHISHTEVAPMAVAMGISLGQKHKPTAISAVEGLRRRKDGSQARESHFTVRFLERMPPGTTFPQAASRLREIKSGVAAKAGYHPEVFVDATGLGTPIVSLLTAEVGCVLSVYFNHGDRRVKEGMYEIRLGKAWLVARLQVLLQTQRLHLPEGNQFKALAEDLFNFEIRVEPDANERYGAFSLGARDDLITALGLAVQLDPPLPSRLYHYIPC